MAITRDDFMNMPAWHKVLMLVGFIILLGVLWYFLVHSSTRNDLTTMQSEIQKLKTEIQKQERAKADKQTLDAQIQKLREQLAILKSKLPEEKEIPMLLSRVNEIGRLNGLEFDRFEPMQPVRKDYYSEIPVKVEVKGGFHQVAFFLYKVGTMDRILHISDLKMGNYEVDGGGKLNASMEATTYKYEPTPLPVSEKPTKGRGRGKPSSKEK